MNQPNISWDSSVGKNVINRQWVWGSWEDGEHVNNIENQKEQQRRLGF